MRLRRGREGKATMGLAFWHTLSQRVREKWVRDGRVVLIVLMHCVISLAFQIVFGDDLLALYGPWCSLNLSKHPCLDPYCTFFFSQLILY